MSTTRLRRRMAAAAVAAALLGAPLALGSRVSAGISADDAIVSGAALASGAVAVTWVNPDFDFWPIYSLSTMQNDTSHGMSGAIWPGFLVDAFFWLYGFQTLERAALGISESQWPNQPHDARASSSRFVMSNFSQGCAFLFGAQGPAHDNCRRVVDPILNDPPGSAGTSTSRSGRLTSSGQADATRYSVPGVLDAAAVRTTTDTRFVDGRTIVEAKLVATDVTIGAGLHVETLEARSVSVATGDAATAKTDSTLSVLGATFNGTPVTIDDQGVHNDLDQAAVSFNDALAAQGLEVRLVQGRSQVSPEGDLVSTSTGGLRIRVFRERAEDAFPAPVREMRQAACNAAIDSPLNNEITRLQVDEPNPLFGRVPFAPLPERAQVEQSVPPPFGCPFVNRSAEVAFVLGFTDAFARLTPVPEFRFDDTPLPPAPVSVGTPTDVLDLGLGAGTPTTAPSVISRAPARTLGGDRSAADSVVLSADFTEDDVAGGLEVLYALLGLMVAGLAVGRYALRSLSAP